jgi:putative ABC transport system permease protein
MVKNYFITAFRNLWRNKSFSLINILGLSIGISAALVIFLIAFYEFGFDKFQPGRERIYRVVMDMKFGGMEGHSAAVPAPLTKAVQQEITGVEQTVPVMTFQGDGNVAVSITKEGAAKPIVFKKQPDVVFTNPQYFYLMPHQWVAGSPNASLKDPFHVVLTESRMRQYFPSVPAADVIGKTIRYNNDISATVTGVVKDLEERSTLTAVEFISYATISQTHLQNDFMMNVWNDWMAYSQLYVKTTTGTEAAKVEKQLAALFKKYSPESNKDAANTMAFKLQPLSDVHFNDHYGAFNQRVARTSTIYGLLAIAAFLLILGCINFINLTTANATQRAKEIGIRKTMGSSKKQLVFQFLGETFLVTCISTIISIALTPLLLNLFKEFIPPGLDLHQMQNPSVLLTLFLLTLVISFASGLYPALILSGYKPALVLKSQAVVSAGETRHAWVRKTLTVSQFVIAQFFIIATIMVGKQISFSMNADMGFKKEAIINFNLPRSKDDSTFRSRANVFMNELASVSGIARASTGFLSPATEGAAFGNIVYKDGSKEVKEQVQVRWGDESYLDVYQIKIIAGRNVRPVDSINECLINEDYAKRMGFTNAQQALNKQVEWNGKNYSIVGIMHDFHQHSTHGLIDPVVFKYGPGDFVHIALQPGSATWSKTIAAIESKYKALYSGEDFNYTFFDDTIAKFYTEEQNTAKLLSWATGLAVLISCMGLLGLVMYTINTRTKEIGIRKILGASVANIVSTLSTEFIKLVSIAFLIAAPIAWWAAYKWLEDFAYRTSMSWWVFALAGVSMLLVALITLSFQTIKAALSNPVKSLRAE